MKLPRNRSHNERLLARQLKSRSTFVLGMPNTLIVEPGAVCSLRCRFCPQSKQDFNFTRGLLNLRDFQRIIGYFEPYLDTVMLFNWGEPLMNPDIGRMVAYASAKGIHTFIHSHFNSLDEALAEELIRGGLFEITASIDGVTQESYAAYRQGGSLERAIANLRLLQEKKRELRADSPRIVWKFLVFRHNEHEMESARLLAGELGIPVEFKFAVTDGTISSTLPEFSSDRPAEKFIRHYGLPCEQLWKSPTIHADGTVLPCCMVSHSRFCAGNVFQQEFGDIWNNEKYRFLREVASGKKEADESVFCYYCMFGRRRRVKGQDA
ncbi:MAG: radical SAM protein [Candidatus Omnitrophica bacterium]|nr:radical SAM protein [Candidatus Omnitrophota bacterium]